MIVNKVLTKEYSNYILYGMMKFKNNKKISYIFLRIVIKLFQLDKKTRYYGTDQSLYEAEIHMIKSIKENEGIHVTGLADMLGVTKGAVSQIIMKLERKGMIIKETDPNNLSRLVLRLTQKGNIAYLHHENLHREFEELFISILENATEKNIEFLKSFLSTLEDQIDTFDDHEQEDLD